MIGECEEVATALIADAKNIFQSFIQDQGELVALPFEQRIGPTSCRDPKFDPGKGPPVTQAEEKMQCQSRGIEGGL